MTKRKIPFSTLIMAGLAVLALLAPSLSGQVTNRLFVVDGQAPTTVGAGDGIPGFSFALQPTLGFIRPAADQIELIGPDDSVSLILPRGSGGGANVQPGLIFNHSNTNLGNMGFDYLPDNNIRLIINSDPKTAFTEVGIVQGSLFGYCFGSDGDPRNGEEDVCWQREAADTMSLVRTTNGQTLLVYGTADADRSPTDYERLSIAHDGTEIILDSQAGGTGTAENVSFRFSNLETVAITPVIVRIEDGHYIEFQQDSDPTAAACDSAAEHGRITVNDGTAGTAGLYVCDQAGASTGWVLVQDLSS